MLFDSDSEDIWYKICYVFFAAKRATVLAEEMGINFNTFLQPFNEFKSALDHITRAQSAGFKEFTDHPNNKKYILENLSKTLGHVYRAFFDTVDWLGITMHEKIIDEVSHYSESIISIAIPDYYPVIRPRLETIRSEIAELREMKDIAKQNEIIPEVDKYVGIIKEQFSFYNKVLLSKSSLIELQQAEIDRQKKNKRKSIWKSYVIPIGIAAILFLLTFIFL